MWNEAHLSYQFFTMSLVSISIWVGSFPGVKCFEGRIYSHSSGRHVTGEEGDGPPAKQESEG